MTSSRRILVTGGAGFIGTHLCRRLRAEGHTVVVLDSRIAQVHGDGAPDPEADEMIQADIRDAEAVRRAMAGAEVLYHLAAETGVGQSQYEIARYVGTNTFGTAVILQAAIAADVTQVILTSSRAVYGEGAYRCPEGHGRFAGSRRRPEDMDKAIWEVRCPECESPAHPLPMAETDAPAPTSIYGITKLQQEELVHSVSSIYDIPVTILRLFNVFGPGQSLKNPYVGVLGTFFRQALSRCPVELYEDGLMSRDFVFIDDVVHVLEAAIDSEKLYGATLNVGTGSAARLIEVAERLYDCLQMDSDIVVSGRYRIGDIRHAVADTARSEATLVWQASTTLADGLAAYVDWARAHPADAVDDTADAQLASRRLLRGGVQ